MSDYYPWNPDGRGCAVGGTLNVPPQGQQALWDSSGKVASWDGLDFLAMARPAEIARGDTFFSPFIAPGKRLSASVLRTRVDRIPEVEIRRWLYTVIDFPVLRSDD